MNDLQDERRNLPPGEVEKLIAATKGGRNEARDRCMLLLMFLHGLRAPEHSAYSPLHRDQFGPFRTVVAVKRKT